MFAGDEPNGPLEDLLQSRLRQVDGIPINLAFVRERG